ncbi:PIN domain-containing protein [Phenylobacterium sp.]|uniref:PIN domain-containing protein n=1 Tax=Phenylobacterium sp. TaxID=1871053 RepID=UPI00286BFA74|nr:PIN domain-containing protein [Phenylobacterium sp.]
MATDAFLDTNILIYLLASESPKVRVSRDVVASGGVISVQVLNEFARVAQRKHSLEWPEIELYLSGFRQSFRVEPLTVATQSRAVDIARAHRFGIYDANILAAAELAGCRIVYSEDMQHGQRVGGLTILNPFADS